MPLCLSYRGDGCLPCSGSGKLGPHKEDPAHTLLGGAPSQNKQTSTRVYIPQNDDHLLQYNVEFHNIFRPNGVLEKMYILAMVLYINIYISTKSSDDHFCMKSFFFGLAYIFS